MARPELIYLFFFPLTVVLAFLGFFGYRHRQKDQRLVTRIIMSLAEGRLRPDLRERDRT